MPSTPAGPFRFTPRLFLAIGVSFNSLWEGEYQAQGQMRLSARTQSG